MVVDTLCWMDLRALVRGYRELYNVVSLATRVMFVAKVRVVSGVSMGVMEVFVVR